MPAIPTVLPNYGTPPLFAEIYGLSGDVFTVYIDGTSGNDDNPGNSVAAPVATLTMAIQRILVALGSSAYRNATIIFQFLDDTDVDGVTLPNLQNNALIEYSGAEAVSLGFAYTAPMILRGGMTEAQRVTLAHVVSIDTDPISGLVSITTDLTLTPNEWDGMVIVDEGGLQNARVVSNDDATFSTTFTSATGPFSIKTVDVTLTGQLNLQGPGCQVLLQGLVLDEAGNLGLSIADGAAIGLECCDIPSNVLVGESTLSRRCAFSRFACQIGDLDLDGVTNFFTNSSIFDSNNLYTAASESFDKGCEVQNVGFSMNACFDYGLDSSLAISPSKLQVRLGEFLNAGDNANNALAFGGGGIYEFLNIKIVDPAVGIFVEQGVGTMEVLSIDTATEDAIDLVGGEHALSAVAIDTATNNGLSIQGGYVTLNTVTVEDASDTSFVIEKQAYVNFKSCLSTNPGNNDISITDGSQVHVDTDNGLIDNSGSLGRAVGAFNGGDLSTTTFGSILDVGQVSDWFGVAGGAGDGSCITTDDY